MRPEAQPSSGLPSWVWSLTCETMTLLWSESSGLGTGWALGEGAALILSGITAAPGVSFLAGPMRMPIKTT